MSITNEVTIPPEAPVTPGIDVNKKVLRRSRLFGSMAIVALIALIILIFIPFFNVPINPPLQSLSFQFWPHILLFGIAIASSYISYRIIAASGVQIREVIPAREYELLAPLVTNANTDAITEYVRLSSLSGFTGKFIQLGLSGLPLATIGLTLIFSIMALGGSDRFLDLAKLTLGAFLGSFVQRQVDVRRRVDRTEKRAPNT